jgi:predicted nucleic acid-binding protein
MTASDFLDSNVLIYAYDPKDPRKQGIARELVEKALLGDGVVSVQVLAEFAATLLHKLRPVVPPGAVTEILDAMHSISVVQPEAGTVRRAVQAYEQYGVQFYDGMIIAAAERAGCKKIWSEDLNAGQEYFGVKVENPFA